MEKTSLRIPDLKPSRLLQNLAGRPIKRPKAGSRDYSELLLPGPSAPPPKPAAPATGPLLVQAPTAKTAPLPALLNAAGDPRPIPAVETAPSAGSSAAVARNAPGTAPARAKSSAAPAKNVPAGRNVLRVHPRVGSAKPEPADPEPADPEPAKPEPANPEPSNPERQTGPAATEPEPNPQVSDAVSSSPPKPKRRRLKKVGAARASKPSEALPGSEGSPEHPPGKDANLSGSDGSDDVANLDGILGDGSDDLADLDCILSEDGGIRFEELTDREDEPVDENEGININLTARENEPVAENEGPIPDADARVAAFRPPRKLRSKPSGKKGASFPHHSASLKAQLPPVAVPPRAANPAVKLHSAVGAVENVIGDEPRSFSSEPPALDPLPANSATPNHANRGAGAGNMTGGGAAEGHVAARGKENSPPGGKEGPLKSASRSEKKRSMGTQTSPSDAGQGAQTNQVGVITAEPIVTETGGTGEGIHTAGMPRILSFERGYQGGVLGERGGTYSTAGDGRVPSLSDSIAPRRGAPASVSAGRALTSADLDCCCTDGCGGAVAEVSGGAAAVTDAVSGGVSGVVHGGVSAAATGRGTSAAGTKRKREDKTAEEGRGKMEGKLDFCAACSKIDEADFRAYVQKKNRARDLSLRLLEIIVGQQVRTPEVTA